MLFELYLSNHVRKQKQFAGYVPFCSDKSLLPGCSITIFEQDRDEQLFSERGLAFCDISSHSEACAFMEAGYYGMPWKDGVLLQCDSVRSASRLPTGLAFVHGDYKKVDLIARTDQLGAFGMYNLLLSSYQYVAINAGAFDWLGLILICIILPAVICPLLNLICRKIGWVKEGDLKLD